MAATARRNLTVSASRSTSFRPAEQDLGDQSASAFNTASAKRITYPLSYLRCRGFRSRVCGRSEPASQEFRCATEPKPPRAIPGAFYWGARRARVRAWRGGGFAAFFSSGRLSHSAFAIRAGLRDNCLS